MRKSLTLTEILVSAFIIATSFVAVTTVFVNVRGLTRNLEKSFYANLIATSNLNNLWLAVREDTWDSGNLSVGNHTPSPSSVEIEGTTYNLSYTVDDKSASGKEYREVDFTISW